MHWKYTSGTLLGAAAAAAAAAAVAAAAVARRSSLVSRRRTHSSSPRRPTRPSRESVRICTRTHTRTRHTSHTNQANQYVCTWQIPRCASRLSALATFRPSARARASACEPPRAQASPVQGARVDFVDRGRSRKVRSACRLRVAKSACDPLQATELHDAHTGATPDTKAGLCPTLDTRTQTRPLPAFAPVPGRRPPPRTAPR